MSNREILVQKFGGTSLADLRGFEASAAIIGQYAAERQVVVVLSAVKGVTDLLLAAIDTAVAGEDGAVHLREAFERQQAIVDDLAAILVIYRRTDSVDPDMDAALWDRGGRR